MVTQETIEMAHGRYYFCQRGVYDPWSVLAGQEFRQLVQSFDTLEAAIAAHPDAIVDLDGVRPEVFIPVNPPDWFDPMDAGESWGEDDY